LLNTQTAQNLVAVVVVSHCDVWLSEWWLLERTGNAKVVWWITKIVDDVFRIEPWRSEAGMVWKVGKPKEN
jgi:hypothetical protein